MKGKNTQQSICIDTMNVRGDWSPLMSKLSGWAKTEGRWSDGATLLKDNAQFFSISLRDYPIIGTENYETLTSPEGAKISVRKDASERKYSLNHFAIEVNKIGGREEKFWANLLKCKDVLRVIQNWDPLIDAPMNAVHFYKPGELYVTLREGKVAKTRFHHMGFEAATKQDVLKAKSVFQKIGWEIFWEGMIDGSYVLHFRAPDGLIHDVFCPEDKLKVEAKALLK